MISAAEFREAYGMTLSEASKILQMSTAKVKRLHDAGRLVVEGNIIMEDKARVKKSEKVRRMTEIHGNTLQWAYGVQVDYGDDGFIKDDRVPIMASRLAPLIEKYLAMGASMRQAVATAMHVERKGK